MSDEREPTTERDLLTEYDRARIRELVAAAPPLTQEQLARIRVLLPPRRKRQQP